MTLGWSGVAKVPEVVSAFLTCEGIEEFADRVADGLDSSGADLAQEMLELGEDLFDWVQVGGVFGQEDQMCAGFANSRSHGFALMAAKVVHDDDVASLKGRHEDFLDVEEKALSVDRAIDEPRGFDAVMPERSKKSHRNPMTVRRPGLNALALDTPAAQWGHVGFSPGLVDEDQSRGINSLLIGDPSGAPSFYVGTLLLGRQ